MCQRLEERAGCEVDAIGHAVPGRVALCHFERDGGNVRSDHARLGQGRGKRDRQDAAARADVDDRERIVEAGLRSKVLKGLLNDRLAARAGDERVGRDHEGPSEEPRLTEQILDRFVPPRPLDEGPQSREFISRGRAIGVRVESQALTPENAGEEEFGGEAWRVKVAASEIVCGPRQEATGGPCIGGSVTCVQLAAILDAKAEVTASGAAVRPAEAQAVSTPGISPHFLSPRAGTRGSSRLAGIWFRSRMVGDVEGCSVSAGQILESVRSGASASGVFAAVRLADGSVECRAQGCASEAFYRVEAEDGTWWVSFVTPDRWLSESIEADLQHTGDDLEELLEEELAEQGLEVRLPYQHYRSEDRFFTFRSPVPVRAGADDAAVADAAVRCLLAYEACFRALGDVAGSSDED